LVQNSVAANTCNESYRLVTVCHIPAHSTRCRRHTVNSDVVIQVADLSEFLPVDVVALVSCSIVEMQQCLRDLQKLVPALTTHMKLRYVNVDRSLLLL